MQPTLNLPTLVVESVKYLVLCFPLVDMGVFNRNESMFLGVL